MKKRLNEELGKITSSVSENRAAISGLSISSSINEELDRLTTSISENSTSIKELSSSINDSQASGKSRALLYRKNAKLTRHHNLVVFWGF